MFLISNEVLTNAVKVQNSILKIDHCIFAACSVNDLSNGFIYYQGYQLNELCVTNSLFYKISNPYIFTSGTLCINSAAKLNNIESNCFKFCSLKGNFISVTGVTFYNNTSVDEIICNDFIETPYNKLIEMHQNNYTNNKNFIHFIAYKQFLDIHTSFSSFTNYNAAHFMSPTAEISYFNFIDVNIDNFIAKSINNSVIISSIINEFSIKLSPINTYTDNQNYTMFKYDKNPKTNELVLNAYEKFEFFYENFSAKNKLYSDTMRFPDFFTDILIDQCTFEGIGPHETLINVESAHLFNLTIHHCTFRKISTPESQLIQISSNNLRHPKVSVTSNCFSDIESFSMILTQLDNASLLFDRNSAWNLQSTESSFNYYSYDRKSIISGFNATCIKSAQSTINLIHNVIMSYSHFENLTCEMLCKLINSAASYSNFKIISKSDVIITESNISHSVFYDCEIIPDSNFIDCTFYNKSQHTTVNYIILTSYLDPFCYYMNKNKNYTLYYVLTAAAIALILGSIGVYLICYYRRVSMKLQSRVNLTSSLVSEFG